MSAEQLADVDIALIICAEGRSARGAPDVAASLKMLDQYATGLREAETARHLTASGPPGGMAEGYFRLLMLGTVPGRIRVRHNPARVTSPGIFEPNEIFANARDVFVHGLTSPPVMGTCRRCPCFCRCWAAAGYPLSWSAQCHLFVRGRITRLFQYRPFNRPPYDDDY
jgi:hypothetical protein